LPEEEFPSLARFEEAKIFTIAQKDLKDGLKKTSYAISVDETRYVLNGILFSFKDNKLTLVATDGRRLALVDLEVEFPKSQETEIIVSTKAVTEIQRLLREEGEVKLSIGENQIAFELNRTLLVSKLIEGNYPNYRQVIPAEAKERISTLQLLTSAWPRSAGRRSFHVLTNATPTAIGTINAPGMGLEATASPIQAPAIT
jgi:DNA polymerase-3 subunit beta